MTRVEGKVNIFLVDDSPLALEILSRILSSCPDFNVVYKASSADEALRFIPEINPDIVCIDYFMPKMQAKELVAEILKKNKVPILVISGLLSEKNSNEIFDVLQAGALDFVPKPPSPDPQSSYAKLLIEKIRVLSKVLVVRKIASPSLTHKNSSFNKERFEIVALGASTGGPSALKTILGSLPRPKIPLVCVQHISTGFLPSFSDWLKNNTSLDCKIVEKRELLLPGCIYFAKESHHLVLEKKPYISIIKGFPQERHCPSVDVLFESVAQNYGRTALGILLTGMGTDGGNGLLAMSKAGGKTIAQSESSCIVYGMPQEAVRLGAAQKIWDLHEIGAYLKEVL